MERLIFHIDVNSAYLSWESVRRVKQGRDDLRKITAIIVERALQAYFDDYYDKQEKLRQIEAGLLVPVVEEKKR